MYGPLIIEDPDDGRDYDDELVVVLDDWIDGTGTTPDQVLENLQKTGMKPMDMGGPMISPTNPLGGDGGDVIYPYYLINGRTTKDPQVLRLPCWTTHSAAHHQRGRGHGVPGRGSGRRSQRHPHRRLPGGAPAHRSR